MQKTRRARAAALTLCVLLAAALLPAALTAAAPAQAQAATAAPSLTVTRAATGKVAVKKGTGYKLGATATAGAKITYKTSKKSVATVTSKGTVKARKAGKATITVKAKKGGKTTTKKVKVTVVKASKYKAVKKVAAKAAASTLYVGKSTKVKATVSPSKASNKNVTFKSSNAAVASVDAYGTVTARRAGTAKITVTSCASSKKKASVKVTVIAYPTGVSVSMDGGVEEGTSATAAATVSPAGAPQLVVWSSSDASVATVSRTGVVTGVAEGYATITAASAADPSVRSSVSVAVAPRDSDGDGIPDAAEVRYTGTDPDVADDADEIENMVVYSSETVVAEGSQVLSADAPRGSEQVSAVLSEAPDGLAEGCVLAVPAADGAPLGTVMRVASVSRAADGTVSVSGRAADVGDACDFVWVEGDADLSACSIVPNDDWELVSDDGEASALEAQDISGSVDLAGGVEGKFALKVPAGKGKGEAGVKVSLSKASYVIHQFGPVPTSVEGTVEGTAGIYGKVKLEGKVSGTVCIAIPGLSSGVTTWKGELGSKKKEASAAANGVYLDLGASFSLDGSFSFDAAVPVRAGVRYSALGGLKPVCEASLGTSAPFDQVSVEAAANASLRANVGIDIMVAGKSLAAATVSAGVDGHASLKSHLNPSMDCVDLGAWFACDATAALLPDNERWKMEVKLTVYKETNSPFKRTWHFEDGKYVGGVGDCTWSSSSGSGGSSSGGTGGGSGTAASYETMTFGTYEQDNNTANGAEDIVWRVLAKEDGKALIISEKALDCQPYNTSYTDVTWADCTLRSWLNSTFYNAAFSSADKQRIAPTSVSNADSENPFVAENGWGTTGGSDTADNVFCLSVADMARYFDVWIKYSSSYGRSEDCKCVPTAYAVAQGAYQSSSYTVNGEGTCSWRLRSPGNYQDYAARVGTNGGVYADGNGVDISHYAVRPALWVNL